MNSHILLFGFVKIKMTILNYMQSLHKITGLSKTRDRSHSKKVTEQEKKHLNTKTCM